jgi:hypothetical protein
VSRLCDRIMRRASPGLDTDLSGLGLSFLYPGNVRKRRPTPFLCFFSWPEHTVFPEQARSKDWKQADDVYHNPRFRPGPFTPGSTGLKCRANRLLRLYRNLHLLRLPTMTTNDQCSRGAASTKGRIGKVFIVVGQDVHRCLVCEGVFTQLVFSEHSTVFCIPGIGTKTASK